MLSTNRKFRLFSCALLASTACDTPLESDAFEDDTSQRMVAIEAEEPPDNPFLADSAWPMSHRNSYNQASSPLPGPTADDVTAVESVEGMLGTITLAFGPTGEIWARSFTHVSTLTADTEPLAFRDHQFVVPPEGEGLSGAYNVVDAHGTFYTPYSRTLLAYHPGGQLDAPEELVLPLEHLGGADDIIVGFNMTFDGMLAFATAQGVVGVISRDFSEIHSLKLGDDEVVSNSIATDENLGIYVVTSERMVRVAWTGSALSLDEADGAWSAEYDTGPEEPAAGRLGPGSGSTPTLMGTGDQDRFVVITDGQPLMHLVLLWRDEIPADWEPIAPGKDRRIAAEIPVQFGDETATTSVSEQSVLVRGYSAMVVNNDYGLDVPDNWHTVFDRLFILLTGTPGVAPHGVEKFTWDPQTRTLESAWVNTDVSCPNGIPTMSAATGLAYCIGQRFGIWTLEALDWDTGASAFHRPLGAKPKYNSAYAATEIGAYGDILTGTISGAVRIRPE